MAKLLSCLFEDLTYEEALEKIKFVKNELDKREVSDISYRVDGIIEINGNNIDFEMNRSENIKRNIRYLDRMGDSCVRYEGEIGLPLTSTLINLNLYKYKGNGKVKEVYLIKSRDKLLTSCKQICEIYLLNIIEKYYNKEELEEEERLLMVGMITNIKEAQKIAGEDEIMRRLIEEEIRLKHTRGLIKTYEDDLEEKESLVRSGIIIGEEKGREIGQEEEKVEIIRKMVQKGFSEEDISNTLELDLTYIKSILSMV